MDQVKIGKFIAECRKKKSLTQAQLAEKLYITDKAVSKWERGIAMPDSSIMLELCDILGITVNDLLSGEPLSAENYREHLENKIIELLNQKEQSDRRLLAIEVVIGMLSVIVMIFPAIISGLFPMEDWHRAVLIVSGFIPAIVGIGFALKIEQVAGYYECKNCGHRYVPTYKALSFSPHVGRTRKLKCPKCGVKSWQKKVIAKEDK